MYKINCMNKIAKAGLDRLTEGYGFVEDYRKANGLLVRSASLHELELPVNLEAIARAGAGVNNIPLERCAERGIVVFNTPGANANGVKELVIAAMIIAGRNLLEGSNWVTSCQRDPELAQLVEKNKSRFAGTEIKGKKLGVIGLGAIGALVANAGIKLEMSVYGYDPYLSVEHAWKLSKHIKPIKSPEEIYRECDFITIHVPLLDATKGLIDEAAIEQMKTGVILLNFSRDIVVDEGAALMALKTGKIAKYITDFPNSQTCGIDNVITFPHLGASTAEAEENCAIMAVEQLMDYLENGNIKNSVNYPNCDLGVCQKAARLAINHKNIPNMLGQLTGVLAGANVNISDLVNKSRGAWAYTLIDLEVALAEGTLERLRGIDGVLRVRVLGV
ncbi:MAG: phosphoglycerate dehydrogenase [Bacillota bacterium]